MDEAVGMGVGSAERARHAGGDGPGPTPERRRMSARRKQAAVLRLLPHPSRQPGWGPRYRGEDLELLSRELGVTAAEPSGWRDRFLAAGEASLKSRPADARDALIDRLQAKAGELTMTTELLEAKIERLEGQRPSRWRDPAERCQHSWQGSAAGRDPPHATGRVGTPETMSQQVSPSTGRVYGLQRVARLWGVARATIYRHRRPEDHGERRRPGPQGAMSDEDLARGDPAAPDGQPVPRARAIASCGPAYALPGSVPADAGFSG